LSGVLHRLDQGGKAAGIVDRHLAEHLAVQLDAGLLQAGHEGGVVHAQRTNSVVDAADPQVAELTLLHAAASQSVVAALHDLLLGHLKMLALGAVEALSELEHLLATCVSHRSAFNTCHSFYLLLTIKSQVLSHTDGGNQP